jgi:CCR4-NOT transcription complex subunit 6
VDAKPHIACLQEVDDYKEHWASQLGSLGYRSKWDCRKGKREGLCLLYKEQVVELLELERVELNDVVKVMDHKEVTVDHHYRDNLAQVALFESSSSGSKFIVVNTHIFWNPMVTDVKLFQVYFLCLRVQEIRAQWGAALPVLLAGDFNSMPHSAVLALLTRQKVPKCHPEFAEYIVPRYKTFFSSSEDHILEIPFKWFNTFAKTEYFTNYTDGFKAQIDYIFVSDPAVIDVRKVGLVGNNEKFTYAYLEEEDYEKVEECAEHKYPLLPSIVWPSDHLGIKIFFRIVKANAK